MKLKYIDINGHGILVDESAKINLGQLGYNKHDKRFDVCNISNKESIQEWWDLVVFAEKELNLDVPILPNWREWEVEQIAEKEYLTVLEKSGQDKDWIGYGKGIDGISKYKWIKLFIEGYNYNKAKVYTEEDLRKAIEMAKQMGFGDCAKFPEPDVYSQDEIIQSFQKLPKYIVMESENVQKTINYHKDLWVDNWQPKLTINSEGKQEGILKEIIYE